MQDRDDILEKVNELLESSDYPAEMKDASDIEDFLNDEDNQVMEEYEEIEKLYNELVGPEIAEEED